MFREMRRKRQEMSPEACEGVLRRGTSGVLAVSGDDGYPYAVPLSYAYAEGRVLFHCAREGHKLEALLKNSKASFCVIDQDQVKPEAFTTCYRSVIVFGRARVLEDENERREALRLLGAKYSPGMERELRQEVERQLSRVCMVELLAEHITGKEAKELVGR